ncbi:MAG: hypothetical protein KGZ57_01195 [Dethiobacter sp.]|nr:hypothetical protein [Dethiobacter sp.]
MSIKIKDRLLLAALCGPLAAACANLFLFAVNLFLPGKTVNMPQVTLEIFLIVGSYTALQRVLGFIWSLVIGGAYTFVYVLVLDWTGWRHLWLKALVVVNASWLFMAGYVMNSLALAVETRHEPLSIAAFFVAHIFFATVMALLVIKFGEE